MRRHEYPIALTWTGSNGSGTDAARSYSRDHDLAADGLPTIRASSDPAFRGDPSRWNPEQLYVASIAQCHMLWYLGLAASAGVRVTGYEDRPVGVMIEERPGGPGQFDHVLLRPRVTIDVASDAALAEDLHDRVADHCFIARSVRTPIHHEVTVRRKQT